MDYFEIPIGDEQEGIPVDRAEEAKIKDAEVAESVMARLTSKGVICPDCGWVCNTVIVERFSYREFTIDYKKKQLIPQNPHDEWNIRKKDYNWAYHCPHCKNNIDEEICTAGIDLEASF